MSNKMMEKLAEYSGLSPEDAFAEYRAGFTRMDPQQRIDELRKVDVWFSEQGGEINKEQASLLQNKRALEDVHFALRKVGR
jgi:hypothetical protein